MADLSHDEAIDALRKLPPDQQRDLLSKLPPDRLNEIHAKLTAAPAFTASPQDLPALRQSLMQKQALKDKAATDATTTAPDGPGFFTRVGNALNLPTTQGEVEAAQPSTAEQIIGPAATAAKMGYGYVKNLVTAGKKAYGDIKEAGENIGEGQPVVPNLGAGAEAGVEFLNRGVLSPVGGNALQNIGEDVANPTVGKGAVAGDAVGGLIAAGLLAKPEEGGPTPASLKERAQNLLVGDKPTQKLVADTLQDNAKATQKAADDSAANVKANAKITQANEDRAAAHSKAVEKVAQSNAQAVAGYGDASDAHIASTDQAVSDHAAEVAEQARQQQEAADTERVRQQTADEHGRLSSEFSNDVENAKKTAQAGVDAAFNPIHEAIGNEQESIAPLQQTAELASQTADPVVLPIAKSLQKSAAATFDEQGRPIINGVPRKVMGGGYEFPVTDPNYNSLYQAIYGELPPVADEGGTASFDRLHRLYGYIGNQLHGGGHVEAGRYNALNMLHHGVNTAMQNIAERTGQTENLANARRLAQEKFETFKDSPSEPQTNASTSLNETTGDWQKEQARLARLDMLSRYDPTIPAKAERIRSLQRTLTDLPSSKQTAATNEPAPEPPVLTPKPKLGKITAPPPAPRPLPLKPEVVEPVIQKVGPDEIRQAKLGALNKRIDWIHHRGEWIATGAGFTGVLHGAIRALQGSGQAGLSDIGESVLMSAASIVATNKLTSYLARPDVQAWMTNVTPRDFAQLDKLPPEQQAVVAEGLRPIVNEALAKGIKVSPTLLTVIGLAGLPKTAGDAKKRVADLKAIVSPQSQ